MNRSIASIHDILTIWTRSFPLIIALGLGVIAVSGGLEAAHAQWATSGNDIHNTNPGNVGIGTTTPGAKFDVNGNIRLSNNRKFIWRNGADTADVNVLTMNNANSVTLTTGPTASGQGALTLLGHNNTTLETDAGRLALKASRNASDSYIYFQTKTSEVMRINHQGNVGIGTTSPTTKLHVAGDVTVTGNIAAKYQDIAEWVPASRSLAAGTVVVLDTQRTKHVLPSSQAYDTRVAGVVSATPGLLLGEAGDHKLKVATTGRISVRVDASRGPIQVGDLLVTSDREGLAMRSEAVDVAGVRIHRPGTLLGKALEPLPEGEGEILVLLSLQ